MPELLKKYKISEVVLVLVSSALMFSPMLYFQIYISQVSDFKPHLEWAQNIYRAPQTLPSDVVAHAGWQWLVWLTRHFINSSWDLAAFLATLASVLASILIMHFVFRKYMKPLLAGSLAIALMLIAPLLIFLPFDGIWYIGGYVWPNVYHNPTTLLLRPFAILQVWYCVKALQGKKITWPVVLLMILGSLAAAYSKPSYIICLLPALFIMVVINLIKGKKIGLVAIIFGIVLPSVVILLWQYSITYSSSTESKIVFDPFVVAGLYSGNLLPKFLLSIAFPLIVTAVYWKEAFMDIKLQLGWLAFGISAVYYYLLAESGPLFPHANLAWGTQITLFLLFAACVLLIAEKKLPPENSFRRGLILAAGFLHIFFGIFYYFFVLFTR